MSILPRKLSTTVYLEVGQVKELERLAHKFRLPKSVIIRQGVDLALNRYRKEEARHEN